MYNQKSAKYIIKNNELIGGKYKIIYNYHDADKIMYNLKYN
jgi:hypothetical protein